MWSRSEDGHAHIRWEVGGLDFALFVRLALSKIFWIINPKKIGFVNKLEGMWSCSEDGHAHIRWKVGGLVFVWFVRAASASRWEVGGLDFALFVRLGFFQIFLNHEP